MPYEVLLKEAHRLIDEMPEEKLFYFVKTLGREEKKVFENVDASMINFVKKYKGSVRRNIDEKAELAAYKNEKYANIN